MYDTAGIEHWITVSKPISVDEDGPEDGIGAKTSKRIYTASDPGSYQPRKRRRGKDMQSDAAPSVDFDALETRGSLSPRSPAASSSSVSLVSSGSKRSRRPAPSSPSKRAMLRAIPSSTEVRAFIASDVNQNALLGFRDLIDKVLDFAEGLATVPAEL
jgi:hypothetical protein